MSGTAPSFLKACCAFEDIPVFSTGPYTGLFDRHLQIPKRYTAIFLFYPFLSINITIGAPGTVNGCGVGIFQYVDAFNIRRDLYCSVGFHL
jgi:hypothetical protein